MSINLDRVFEKREGEVKSSLLPCKENMKRENIAKRAKEGEKAYKEGKIKMGGFEDLWKDLND